MAWINLPDGNQIDSVLIRSVMLYPGRGIALRDAQQRLIAFIRIENIANGERARDVLFDRIKNSRPMNIDWGLINQTDWRTLNDSDELPTDAAAVN